MTTFNRRLRDAGSAKIRRGRTAAPAAAVADLMKVRRLMEFTDMTSSNQARILIAPRSPRNQERQEITGFSLGAPGRLAILAPPFVIAQREYRETGESKQSHAIQVSN